MISKHETQDILQASLYFNELFKKTLVAATPSPITTKTQMNIAVALFAHEPMNMSALSSRVSIAPEQTTRAVKALREKGLVVCEKSPESKREVIARLSEEGDRLLREQLDEFHTCLNSYLGSLTQEEKDELVALSQKAVSLFKKTDFTPIIPEKSRVIGGPAKRPAASGEKESGR